MAHVIFLHVNLANTAWLLLLVVGAWGAWRAIRGEGIDGSYMGALAIAQMLIWAQSLLGLIYWSQFGMDGVPRPWIHWLYGLFSALFIPAMYFAVLKGDDSNRGQWVMSFACFFMFGIALRGISTAVY
jgi:hypothetical protein